MTDSTTSGNQPNDSPTSVASAESTAGATPKPTAEASEANPLKRYQDLVNSPETPDGHKVVAAVAAASTVTVAAVANWLMKATKKATPSPTKDE